MTSRIMSNILKKYEYDVKVLCFNEDARDGDYVCQRGETVHDSVDNVEIVRCGCFAKISSQSLSLTYPRELKKVMNDFKPELIIFHYPNPYISQFLLNYKKRNFKLLVYYNLDITKQKILGKLFYFQTLSVLNRADKVIATSPNYIEGSPYLKKFRDKEEIISCCFVPERLKVTDEIKMVSKEIKSKNKEKIICFAVGRHVPYKGLKYLIDASKYLDNRFSVVIGGKGPLTELLKQQAYGDNKIEFVGRLSDDQLVAYYNACDIFCFPSITKNEAFGMSLAEAMCFGKPAVTFTIPGSGVNYVNLDGVTGIECPNGDSKAYADALKKLADDPELREKYGNAARKRVLENFTEEIFEKNLMKMIDNLK